MRHARSLRRRAAREIVDHVFATYVSDPKVARFALRMAYQLGLVPTLAETQTVFARSLATALAARTDLGPPRDYSVTAYVLTHAMMGVVHTLLWQDSPAVSREAMRRELIAMVLHTLRRD